MPTYRNPEPLAETLACLRELDYPDDDYEIIVVEDGGSAPDRREDGSGPRVLYTAQPAAGAAAARNRGARLAVGDVLILLDDDMLVPKHLIQSHLESLKEYAPAAISGYRVFAPDLAARLAGTPFGRFRLEAEPKQEWGVDYERRAREARTEPFATLGGLTANDLAVRREDFLRIGGFDEEFPHAGYEDQELALRAERAGIRCLVNWRLVAWHNDRRLTLDEFLNRQRRGALSAVLLASKYPCVYGDRALFRENGPLDLHDPIALSGKKLAKALLCTRPGLQVLFISVRVTERLAPGSRLLPRLYSVATGLYTFQGVREGWTRYQPHFNAA